MDAQAKRAEQLISPLQRDATRVCALIRKTFPESGVSFDGDAIIRATGLNLGITGLRRLKTFEKLGAVSIVLEARGGGIGAIVRLGAPHSVSYCVRVADGQSPRALVLGNSGPDGFVVTCLGINPAGPPWELDLLKDLLTLGVRKSISDSIALRNGTLTILTKTDAEVIEIMTYLGAIARKVGTSLINPARLAVRGKILTALTNVAAALDTNTGAHGEKIRLARGGLLIQGSGAPATPGGKPGQTLGAPDLGATTIIVGSSDECADLARNVGRMPTRTTVLIPDHLLPLCPHEIAALGAFGGGPALFGPSWVSSRDVPRLDRMFPGRIPPVIGEASGLFDLDIGEPQVLHLPLGLSRTAFSTYARRGLLDFVSSGL